MSAKIAIGMAESKSISRKTRIGDCSHPTWHWIIPPAILTFLSFMLYMPSLRYDFKFDDLANILKFFEIRHKSFKDIFFTGRPVSYNHNSFTLLCLIYNIKKI
jgi:hypothetical protein